MHCVKKDEIIAALEANPPATLKEAQALLKDVTGVGRSLTQVSEFHTEHKIARRKVKQIPAKADVEAQETFKTETLGPLIEQAQQKKIHLFFVDAAHFVRGLPTPPELPQEAWINRPQSDDGDGSHSIADPLPDLTEPDAQAGSRVPEGQAQRSLDAAEHLATVVKAVERTSCTHPLDTNFPSESSQSA